MMAIRKRGKGYHADLMHGKVHVVRGSLGTRNQDTARRLIHKLEIALAEGPLSTQWLELHALLPFRTYQSFSEYSGVKPKQLPTCLTGMKLPSETLVNFWTLKT
jgi:hypothetical protein